MASFQRRNGKVRVQIRKEGTYVCRTFTHMADAKRWATQEEAAIECADLPTSRRKHQQTVRLGELIERYAREVTPRRRGGISRSTA